VSRRSSERSNRNPPSGYIKRSESNLHGRRAMAYSVSAQAISRMLCITLKIRRNIIDTKHSKKSLKRCCGLLELSMTRSICGAMTQINIALTGLQCVWVTTPGVSLCFTPCYRHVVAPRLFSLYHSHAQPPDGSSSSPTGSLTIICTRARSSCSRHTTMCRSIMRGVVTLLTCHSRESGNPDSTASQIL
jgi:hypothetical protein